MRISYSAHSGIRTNTPSNQNIQEVNATVRAADVIIILGPAGLKELLLDP